MAGVIECRDIAHRYPDETLALDGIDISIAAGERVAIIGPNGAGKSTLHLILSGLLAPTTGSVRYFESTTDAETIRHRLGSLLQDPNDYLFHSTVREDLEYGPSQFGIPSETARERIDALADTLGLDGLLDQPPFRLSGGEKQRAAVASVFAFAPDVILLDEPFGAVDAKYRARILELINEHAGTSVIFTPDLNIVPALADRVILLGEGGLIAADGSVREILTDEALLAENGLRPPLTVQLFSDYLDDESVPLTTETAQAWLDSELTETGRHR